MGKGNNNQNQQRFQGAAQQQQGQKDEQAKQPPAGGPAADGTATSTAVTGVPSGDGAEGTTSTSVDTATAVQSGASDDGRGEQERAAGEGSVPAVPPVETAPPAPVLIEEVVAIPAATVEIGPLAAGLLASFNEYAEVMNPRRPTTVSAGISYQRRLFRTIQSIINDLEGKDFDVVFGNVLAQIEANTTGAFADLAVFRHLELREMNLVPVDRRSFRDILNFLLKIAPLKSRAFVAKQVNLDATFAGNAFSEDGRQRVQNYCRID